MIRAYLLDKEGGRLDLPPLLAWKLKRTGSVPCDSFEGECLWSGGLDPRLEGYCRLIVEEEGRRRFTGVLDECRLTWDQEGSKLTVSGRGLCALLLDNEAAGQDYQCATLADILQNHVTPYGIQTKTAGSLPAVPGFSVATGSSQWQVLESFARYHGGGELWFDVYGDLTVGEKAGRTVKLGPAAGPLSVAWRDKRYGVYSEILVQDRGKLAPQRVANEDFIAQGGCCRRVYTMPEKSVYQAMRYSGGYQLKKSWAERFRLEITLPGSWFCEPGDWVEVSLSQPKVRGTWRALETQAVLDEKGPRVKLILGKE